MHLLRPLVREAWPGWALADRPTAASGASVASGASGAAGGAGGKSRFRALPPREACLEQMRMLSVEQRTDAAAAAATMGDSLRLEGLHALGFDLSAELDEYGQSALFLAATHGHARLVRTLISLGADPRPSSHGGATAASAAAACGHYEVLAVLGQHGADVHRPGAAGLTPLDYVLRRAASGMGGRVRGLHPALPSIPLAPRLVTLIEPAVRHPGAGACYIDGGVPEELLLALDELFGRLPMAARQRCSQGLNDRSYFCDVEGWVTRALAEAVHAACEAGGVAPCQGSAMPQMRYLQYAEVGGGLPPHVDLSRTRDGRTSTCTFILYLTDCERGGETVLLQRLAQPSRVHAAVTPRRGRLLLFPHLCPHLAREVVAEGLPKLLLRGEMY